MPNKRKLKLANPPSKDQSTPALQSRMISSLRVPYSVKMNESQIIKSLDSDLLNQAEEVESSMSSIMNNSNGGIRNLKSIVNNRFSQIMDIAHQSQESISSNPYENLIKISEALLQLREGKVRQLSETSSPDKERIENLKQVEKEKEKVNRRVGLREDDQNIKKVIHILNTNIYEEQTRQHQIRQFQYYEADEMLVESQLSTHRDRSKALSHKGTYNGMWLPSFRISFLYKSMNYHWLVKMISQGQGSNHIFLFDETYHRLIYSFQIPDIPEEMVENFNPSHETFWPVIADLYRKKIEDKQCQVPEESLQYGQDKTKQEIKQKEQNYLSNQIRFIVSNLAFEEKKSTGRVLMFLPSRLKEVVEHEDYQQFITKTKQLCRTLIKYQKDYRRIQGTMVESPNQKFGLQTLQCI